MTSVSFEELVMRTVASSDLSASQGDAEYPAIQKFILSFRLRNDLALQMLRLCERYPSFLRTIGSSAPQSPLNQSFEEIYNIHTLVIPDKIFFHHMDIFPIAVPYSKIESHTTQKTLVGLPGFDSFSVLDDGRFLVSGAIRGEEPVGNSIFTPVLFCIDNQQANLVHCSEQARQCLQEREITNLYGFFQCGNTIYFGTWGRRSDARLMRAELNGLLLDNVVDVTPPEITENGYDDLFVRKLRKGWFQVGIKPGPTTPKGALYFVEAATGQVLILPLEHAGIEDGLELDELGGRSHYSYTHQFYEICPDHFASITSGRLGSILRIIGPSGRVCAKYFINQPCDHTPFTEYPWAHTLKHPSSSYLYVPDNDEVIHRFHYDPDQSILFVLKFRLPVSGEISALTATSDGFCVALTCNHRNLVLKVTEDLLCFQVYENVVEDTPFSILHVQGNTIRAATGSRYYPTGLNYARYCHYAYPRSETGSEVVTITTDSLEKERGVAQQQAQAQMRKFLVAMLLDDPANYEIMLHLAQQALQMGEPAGCIFYCKQALAAEKTTLIPYKIMGHALAAQGRYEEALIAINAYHAEMPEDRDLARLRNDCLAHVGASRRKE